MSQDKDYPEPQTYVAAPDAQRLSGAQNNVIDGLMAENEKLRKALVPFAEVASRFDGLSVSTILPQQCWFTPQILREARTAIATAASPQSKLVAVRAQAIEDVLAALKGHELYNYRPKAFEGFIQYAREQLINEEVAKDWR